MGRRFLQYIFLLLATTCIGLEGLGVEDALSANPSASLWPVEQEASAHCEEWLQNRLQSLDEERFAIPNEAYEHCLAEPIEEQLTRHISLWELESEEQEGIGPPSSPPEPLELIADAGNWQEEWRPPSEEPAHTDFMEEEFTRPPPHSASSSANSVPGILSVPPEALDEEALPRLGVSRAPYGIALDRPQPPPPHPPGVSEVELVINETEEESPVEEPEEVLSLEIVEECPEDTPPSIEGRARRLQHALREVAQAEVGVLESGLAPDAPLDTSIPPPNGETEKERSLREELELEMISEGPSAPKELTIDFPSVDIKEFIRFVSRLSGKNFIYNEGDLDFTVTIISEEPTSVDDIMAALLQELTIHGLSMMEQGGSLIIHRSSANSPATVIPSPRRLETRPDIVTRVFSIANISAEKMAEVVRPMLSPQALVQVVGDTNTVVITDIRPNMVKISDLVGILDIPSGAYEVGQYYCRTNFVEELVPLAQRILDPIAQGSPITLVPQASTNSVFIVGDHSLVARAMAIFERLDTTEGTTEILTSDELARRAQALIGTPSTSADLSGALRRGPTFDQLLEREFGEGESALPEEISNITVGDMENLLEHMTSGELAELPEDHHIFTQFYVFPLEHQRGDEIIDALLAIADSLRLNERANLDLINAVSSAQWIPATNSIVVTGTPETIARVADLLLELDAPVRQVFLEMLILDTSLSNALNFSVDWGSNFAGKNYGAAQGWSDLTPSETSGSLTGNPFFDQLCNPELGPEGPSALVDVCNLAAAALPGYNLGVVGRRICANGCCFGTIGALIRALHTDTTVEIVLNPKIVVEDNHTAEIFVGENTAYQSQTIVNNEGNIVTANVEYRDIGTLLRVTPHIGCDDIVTLEIEEEQSSVVEQQSSTVSTGEAGINPGPTTSTNRTITRAHMQSGWFVILSGVIRDEKRKIRRQIPCLGGLPFLGALAGGTDDIYSKRNLLIFIRPVIIDTPKEYREVTRRQQNIWKDKNRRRSSWKFETDEMLELMNLPGLKDNCKCTSLCPPGACCTDNNSCSRNCCGR